MAINISKFLQCCIHFDQNIVSISSGIIHLVHTQNFPKNEHFLPPDMH